MNTKNHIGNNGDICFENVGNSLVEFFSKAGSLFEKKKSFYGNESNALDLFKNAFMACELSAVKLLFWLRDIRGGAGNRSGFRSCLNWLAQNHPAWVKANVDLIPHYGRWDDLKSLYDTECEIDALRLWGKAIKSGHSLACKWAGRKDNKLRSYLKITPKIYRQTLALHSKVVEQKMCSKAWNEIEYAGVPSVAMARYTNAFTRNDPVRFYEYKDALKSGDVKINTGAIFPHDCVRTSKTGDSEIANAQFAGLPNFIKNDKKIMAVTDFSGSMNVVVSGSVTAMDIALGLGLYCSDRIARDNPFYRKFLAFSKTSRIINWENIKFSDAVRTIPMKYEFVESTDIYSALINLLKYGKEHSADKDNYPEVILILSDMQFDIGAKYDKSAIEQAFEMWDEAGIKRPNIVYWNLAGYGGNQAKSYDTNVSLVSGFSPTVLKQVFESKTPFEIMKETIDKYEINLP